MTVQNLSSATHIPEAKVRASVERMTEAGLLEPSGNGKSRMYLFSPKLYESKAGYVRQSGIERIRYPELVLKLAKTQGAISRKDVVQLLRVTPPQAYRILQKLVKDGKLIPSGNARNAIVYKVP